MVEQQPLNLGDRDVLTAADEVLGTPCDTDIAIGIHAGGVAGIKPAVRVVIVAPRRAQIADAIRTIAHLEAALLAGAQRYNVGPTTRVSTLGKAHPAV